jgi:hypothetical protein
MIYLLIAIWLLLAWHLIAKRFPNDGIELRPWMWFLPFIPILYGLLFITALVEVMIAISIGGVAFAIKNQIISLTLKNKKENGNA